MCGPNRSPEHAESRTSTRRQFAVGPVRLPFDGRTTYARQCDAQLRYFTAPCASRCSISLFTLRMSSEVAVQKTGLVMQW
jgi:hypothetical protein